jgi:hypothetical protein
MKALNIISKYIDNKTYQNATLVNKEFYENISKYNEIPVVIFYDKILNNLVTTTTKRYNYPTTKKKMEIIKYDFINYNSISYLFENKIDSNDLIKYNVAYEHQHELVLAAIIVVSTRNVKLFEYILNNIDDSCYSWGAREWSRKIVWSYYKHGKCDKDEVIIKPGHYSGLELTEYLYWYACHYDTSLIDILLKKNINITSLTLCCVSENTKVLKLLLRKGKFSGDYKHGGTTIFKKAIEEYDLELLKLLCDHKQIDRPTHTRLLTIANVTSLEKRQTILEIMKNKTPVLPYYYDFDNFISKIIETGKSNMILYALGYSPIDNPNVIKNIGKIFAVLSEDEINTYLNSQYLEDLATDHLMNIYKYAPNNEKLVTCMLSKQNKNLYIMGHMLKKLLKEHANVKIKIDCDNIGNGTLYRSQLINDMISNFDVGNLKEFIEHELNSPYINIKILLNLCNRLIPNKMDEIYKFHNKLQTIN